MDDGASAAAAGRARNLANGRASALPRAHGVQRVEVGWQRVYGERDSSLLERGPLPSRALSNGGDSRLQDGWTLLPRLVRSVRLLWK
jgi:hypothetical protein